MNLLFRKLIPIIQKRYVGLKKNPTNYKFCLPVKLTLNTEKSYVYLYPFTDFFFPLSYKWFLKVKKFGVHKYVQFLKGYVKNKSWKSLLYGIESRGLLTTLQKHQKMIKFAFIKC